MKTYTAEEWNEIQRKNYIAWAKKQGVDFESGKFTLADGMKLATRAAAERHWVLEHGCDMEIPTEPDEEEIQDYEEAFDLTEIEETLELKGISLYELHLFLSELEEFGHFAFDQIELEGCEDEIEGASEGEACLVSYS